MREKLKSLSILLLTVFVLCVNLTFGQSRASFGEPCDRLTRCDSRASLACTNSTCQCIKENEMTFDPVKGKCVVLVGERCSYTAIEVLMDLAKEKRWTEKLDCVENAICSTDGYCACKSEFYENSRGFCEAKRSHGGICLRDDECRTDKHLSCVGGKCSCNASESVFDSGYGQCVAKVSSSCAKYGLCVRNAFCSRQRGCCGGRDRDRDLCQCSSDYKRSKEGLCLGSYGVGCNSESSPCSEDLQCVNGLCTCHFPQHQSYNRTLAECVSALRGPCLETREGVVFNYTCGENAECRKEDGTSFHVCGCKDGYIESDKRNCRLKYGSRCNHHDVCDKVADLQCSNGFCRCKDLQFYDEQRGICRGLLGAVCNMTRKDFCGDGGYCEQYRDEKMGMGVCRCKREFVPNQMRGCSLKEVDAGLNGIEGLEIGGDILENATTTTEDSVYLELKDGESIWNDN